MGLVYRPTETTFIANLIDSLVYALITAGIIASMWPTVQGLPHGTLIVP